MHDAGPEDQASPQRIRVLLIEDDPRDALLVREFLKEAGDRFEVVHVTHIEAATPLLQDPSIDVILVDLHLPDASGIQAVVSAHAGSISQPILAITGSGSQDSGLEAVRLGAQDFLVKDGLTPTTLSRAILYAIERQRLIGCMRDSVRASLADGANLRRLLGGSEALVVVGEDGTIRFANEMAEGMFGWAGREHMGQPFELLSLPGVEVEQEITRPDGSTVAVEIRTVDVLWQDQPARLVSLRDVSERRRAVERQMRLDTLTNFLGNVSHELRTPLSAIYQIVSNVSDGIVGPITTDQRDHLRTALRNVDEVLAMIANLLEVARSQAGKLRIDPQIIRLADETRVLLDVFRASARERGVSFMADIPADLPPLLVDPSRVRQIITNLVENAIKFTPSPGEVRLEAMPAADGKRVVIRVSDTGCGVPKAHVDRIFEQLHQVPESTYRTRRGLGLGLFITRQLVQGLQGEIRVQSEPGKGSSFEVFLPVLSWPTILASVESMARESGHGLQAIRIQAGWADGDLIEPVPDSHVWAMNELLQREMAGRRHVLLPRAQVGGLVHLGSVFTVEGAAAPGAGSELRERLRAEIAAMESAVVTVVTTVEGLALTPGVGQGSDIASRLERFYLQPRHEEESWRVASRTVSPPA